MRFSYNPILETDCEGSVNAGCGFGGADSARRGSDGPECVTRSRVRRGSRSGFRLAVSDRIGTECRTEREQLRLEHATDDCRIFLQDLMRCLFGLGAQQHNPKTGKVAAFRSTGKTDNPPVRQFGQIREVPLDQVVLLGRAAIREHGRAGWTKANQEFLGWTHSSSTPPRAVVACSDRLRSGSRNPEPHAARDDPTQRSLDGDRPCRKP